MSSKSGVVKFKDIKQGKIFWEVAVYINSDGEVTVTDPSRIVVHSKPYKAGGDVWSFVCSQVIYGVQNGISIPWLMQFGIVPHTPNSKVFTEIESGDVKTHDRLFKTESAAKRYYSRMLDYVPTTEEMDSALLYELEVHGQNAQAEVSASREANYKEAFTGSELHSEPFNYTPPEVTHEVTEEQQLQINAAKHMENLSEENEMDHFRKQILAGRNVINTAFLPGEFEASAKAVGAILSERLNVVPSSFVEPEPGTDIAWDTLTESEKNYFRHPEYNTERQKGLMTFGEMMLARDARQKDKDALLMETPSPKISMESNDPLETSHVSDLENDLNKDRESELSLYYETTNDYGFPQVMQRDPSGDFAVCAESSCRSMVMPNKGGGTICDKCAHKFFLECQHDS